jgi:16S rRNA (guanine527-N7)-methyltransferase
VSALNRYLDELYRWNERINLTAVPREEAEVRHIRESERLLAASAPDAGARCVDIGSGGGIPGLVMALLRPDLHITLVESDQRKAAFLTHAAAICEAAAVRVVAQRAEVVGRDAAERETYDLAVSRATAATPALVELALPLLRVGGRLAALVADAGVEARTCRYAAEVCGGADPVALAPDILGVTKVAATSDTYPRAPGVPRRKPLQ